MALLEIRKGPDGKILARRKDGLPLTAEDRQRARDLAALENTRLRAWVVDEVREGGELRAVLICSAMLEDHFWIVLDRGFIPHDGLACYYSEEIPLLKDKSPEDLVEIHKAKLAFPGSRIIQEDAEKEINNERL